MSGEPLRRTVTVTDPLGLHMRPLQVFVTRALKFQSDVYVRKGAERVNGKSILEVLLLAAEQGTQLELEVCGSDAAEAIDALADLLAASAPPDDEAPVPKKG